MPGRKRATPHDEDFFGDEGGIDFETVRGAKMQLNKIREEREKSRAQLHKNLEGKLAALQERIAHTVDAHTEQLAAANQQQLDRLREALEAREAIHQRIQEKMSQLRREGSYLAVLLDKSYEYRLEKAEAVDSPLSAGPKGQQKEQQGVWANHKRVKMDHNGSG